VVEITPAVARALSLATAFARANPCYSREKSLLLALLDEREGSASQLMVEAGLDIHAFWQINEPSIPSVQTGFRAAEAALELLPQNTLSEWSDLLRQARQLAREWGTYGEITSRHLVGCLLLNMQQPTGNQSEFHNLTIHHGLNLDLLSNLLNPEPTRVLSMDEPLFAENLRKPADPVARLLDACANRAREGLRVVEDHTRFCRNSLTLTRWLKELRHGLRDALDLLPRDLIRTGLATRDVPGDVGTTFSTMNEMSRTSASSVAIANLKRVQESLRSLEEYSKLFSAEAAARFETLRYSSYGVEKLLAYPENRTARLAQSCLYMLVTASKCALGLEKTVCGALDGGVDIIQSREKNYPDREWLADLVRLRRWTEDAGALLVVNDRADLALASGADGVHVGQDDMPVSTCRSLLGNRGLVGMSTHSRLQMKQAISLGADMIGVGPVFPSGTKSFDEFPGLDLVREAVSEQEFPWFALGGIHSGNLPLVCQAGATRVAVSGAILVSEYPATVARELRRQLDACHSSGG